MQLNQYLEENAIIQLDQKAGKDQGKFQVKTNIKVYKIYYIFFAGELQEAWELSERPGEAICDVATLRGQGGGWKVSWSVDIF